MSRFVAFRDANLTNEEGAGRILAKIVGQSVVVGLETSLRVEEKGSGANASVDVQVGEVIILDADGFALRAWSDAIENVLVTSNSSGNPRIDVVVAYVDKAVQNNATNNSPGGLVFDIVDGTPAGSPSPPNDATIQSAVGADNPFIKLAQIAVADSFVSIVNANITDIRKQFSIQSGGKTFQYNVATNLWTLQDSLNIETALLIADSERLGVNGSDKTTIGKNSERASVFVPLTNRIELLSTSSPATTFTDIDVTANTSPTTFAIMLKASMSAGAAARNLEVRKKGSTDVGIVGTIIIRSIGTALQMAGQSVGVDTDQIFQYKATINTDTVVLDLIGYWKYVD